MEKTEASGSARPLRLACFELRDQELAWPIEIVRETPPIVRIAVTPESIAAEPLRALTQRDEEGKS